MASKKDTSVLKFDDLKYIWRTLVQNWYLPLIIIPLFYLLGYFMAYKQLETYEVGTQLLLKNNDQYNRSSLISEESGFYGSVGSSFVDNSNEQRVITSYDMIEKVVSKLKSKIQVSYYIIGRVRTKEEFSGMPFTVDVNNINSSLYEAPFLFRILNEKTYEISYKEGDKEVKQQGTFGKELLSLNYDFFINSNFFTSANVGDIKQMQYEFVVHSIPSLVYGFQGSLKVENPDYTNILKLTISDNLVERASLFLDTLSKLYIDNSLKNRFDLNERTMQYIDRQMVEVSAQLKYYEDTMQNYKSNRGILDLNREETDYFTKLSTYDNQRTQLNLQIESLNDLEEYIIQDKDPQFLPPSAFVSTGDGFLSKSAGELYALQSQLNQMHNTSKDKNYAVTNLENNIKKSKQDLLVYISNARSAIKNVIGNINKEIATYVGGIKTIPQKQRELLGIQRSLSINEGLYTFLLQKRANTYIARATIIAETKVIESPRPTGIVTPNKKKIILQYIFVGIALCVLIILIRFFFFTTIQNTVELKEVTNTPVLGDLLQVKNMSPVGITVDEDPKSHIAENFRTLRTNLQYLSIDTGKKIILFTSNAPGEGKTFTSINMATMLAKGGKKVLLLELDLHKPRVQKALEMYPDKGISTIVAGQHSIEESIKKTRIENLEVLLSGPVPPNPSEMVLSQQLKEIFAYGKTHYDYTIIDTPPVSLISDAVYMMQYADISLFVLNTKNANKHIVTIIDDLIENNQIKHFAYILNGVKRQNKIYYYAKYGKGYSYGYGYGYGYGYSKK
ncbi:MAG: polysaccharide biosynthesis tyrosine autokinase [Bacteroidetes bacterium]|nr:polysaccharide biosynthesis tyrosine autokinase [Bacteroidota bacterium]